MSVLSLYIPIISANISESYIKKMFKTHNIGQILRADFVKNVVKNRREAFIHFDEWFSTTESKKLQEDVLNPNTKSRLNYTKSGKYWPLLKNNNAHQRINNPKYVKLTSEDTNTEYEVSLNIQRKNDTSTTNHNPLTNTNSKKQKQDTYATKTAVTTLISRQSVAVQ